MSYWFKRLIEYYQGKGIYYKKHSKYPFAEFYYKSGIYNLHLLSVPLDLKEINYKSDISRERIEKQSIYDEAKDTGKLEGIKNETNLVRGYWATIHKINKRFYMMRNSQEFLKNVQSLSKNKTT